MILHPQDIVITRDNKLAKVVNLSREDGVWFAWIKYLDGSNPSGQGAIDPEAGICEHRVTTGKVMSGTDYYNDSHWTTERGLRRPTPYNLKVAGIACLTGATVRIKGTDYIGQVNEVDPEEGLAYVEIFELGIGTYTMTDIELINPATH